MTEGQAQRRRPSWRAVAIGSVAATAGIAGLIALCQAEPPAPRFQVTVEDAAPAKSETDPLMAELLRCRSLPAGSDDAACRQAWEVNRRRFMGESRTYVPPASTNADQGC